ASHFSSALLLFSVTRLPRLPPLFPYTTLFRSRGEITFDDSRVLTGAGYMGRDEGDCLLVRCIENGIRLEEVVDPLLSRRHALRRSEEHTSELQSRENLVCRLLLEEKNTQ